MSRKYHQELRKVQECELVKLWLNTGDRELVQRTAKRMGLKVTFGDE